MFKPSHLHPAHTSPPLCPCLVTLLGGGPGHNPRPTSCVDIQRLSALLQRRHLGHPLTGVSSGFTSLQALVGSSRSMILVSYYHSTTPPGGRPPGTMKTTTVSAFNLLPHKLKTHRDETISKKMKNPNYMPPFSPDKLRCSQGSFLNNCISRRRSAASGQS